MFRLAHVFSVFAHIDGIDVSTESVALSLLQFASEAEVSERCESWCNEVSQCSWGACKSCSYCPKEPEGCKSFCREPGHCGWAACKDCQYCTVPPTLAPTLAPTPAPTAAPTPCDNSDLCRDVGGNCCGIDWLTMTCAEGYEPEVVGACGLIGGQTAFKCKLKEHDDSMCDGILGDKCCGIDGVSVNCKYGYEAVPTGKCGVVGLRTKFTCKRPELDDSKCDSGLVDACCGIKGVTVKCKDGFEVVETGSCGVPGIEARTKYSCKPRCSP